MPCWERFERQDQGYSDAVLPPAVKARVSIEAGATLGWQRWVGDARRRARHRPLRRLGAGRRVAKAFGFTAEHVAETASALLQRT